MANLVSGTRVEEIDIQKIKVDSAVLALSDAKKDLMNKLRDVYSKSDDAVRSKADQLFSNPRSSNPKLDITISNTQLRITLESQRINVEQVLLSWGVSVNEMNILNSDFSALVADAYDSIFIIQRFLDNMALAVNELDASASISQTVVDGYKTDVWSARSNLNTGAVNLTASVDNMRSAQSALSLAQGGLDLKEAGATSEELAAQAARVVSAQANVDSVLARFVKTRLVSPITGVVTSMDVEVGEIAPVNVSIVSVISINDFKIEANVAEADISNVMVGDISNVTLDAYGSDVVFKSVVSGIDPAAVIIEGVPTYNVTFSFLNESDLIRAGMTANIDILIDKRTDVISVPIRTVGTKGKVKTVKILKEDGSIDEVVVRVGMRSSDGRIEIVEGLKEGDNLITFMP